MLVAETHPYYPLGAEIPHYVPNTRGAASFLSLFSALLGAVVLLAWKLAERARAIRGKDRFAAVWFASCGYLHIFFEGYLVLHHDKIPGMNTLFSQAWKEYALSDSRYFLSDPFVISIETITTCVWGPLSLLTFLAILTKSPARHILQTTVCVAHISGVSLYYATERLSHSLHGVAYSRPEALYFWAYFVGANAPWFIVPLYLLKDSYDEIVRAFNALEDKEKKHV